eukprot:COSAG02_NODE_753_length_17610_cov_23.119753_12_plen_135_part_00
MMAWAPDARQALDARQTDAGRRRQQQSGEQGGGNTPADQLPVQTPFRLQAAFVEQPACACTEQLSACKNNSMSVLHILVIHLHNEPGTHNVPIYTYTTRHRRVHVDETASVPRLCGSYYWHLHRRSNTRPLNSS